LLRIGAIELVRTIVGPLRIIGDTVRTEGLSISSTTKRRNKVPHSGFIRRAGCGDQEVVGSCGESSSQTRQGDFGQRAAGAEVRDGRGEAILDKSANSARVRGINSEAQVLGAFKVGDSSLECLGVTSHAGSELYTDRKRPAECGIGGSTHHPAIVYDIKVAGWPKVFRDGDIHIGTV